LAALKALVVGAGIGGLTAALCLSKQGFDVMVFEQSSHLGEIGAGIQLSPNCSRVLHYLGLEPVINRTAFVPEGTEIRHWKSGEMLSSIKPRQLSVNNRSPFYHIHRADLIAALTESIDGNPKIEIHTSSKVEAFQQEGNVANLILGDKEISGDLIVGADGIHSVIREGLFGDDKPRFTGNVAWRGLVPADKFSKELVKPVTGLWWGPGKHFVHYYVRGGEMINCVCVVEKKGWEVESWTERGNHSELVQEFTGWHETIVGLIDAMETEECYQWALFDRSPLPHWGNGCVGLLGDSCHATLPFLAQGAAMAIEDAAVLAASVATHGIEKGLQTYEQLRKVRTAKIQNVSRRNAKIFHMRGINAWARNRVVDIAAKNTMNWIYDYDALGNV